MGTMAPGRPLNTNRLGPIRSSNSWRGRHRQVPWGLSTLTPVPGPVYRGATDGRPIFVRLNKRSRTVPQLFSHTTRPRHTFCIHSDSGCSLAAIGLKPADVATRFTVSLRGIARILTTLGPCWDASFINDKRVLSNPDSIAGSASL